MLIKLLKFVIALFFLFFSIPFILSGFLFATIKMGFDKGIEVFESFVNWVHQD